MSGRTPEPCDGLTSEHTGPVRFYRTGWKCPAHTPWAESGRPEPLAGPGLPHGERIPSQLSDSALFDSRAIASGKRRSSPKAYRAAQASMHHAH